MRKMHAWLCDTCRLCTSRWRVPSSWTVFLDEDGRRLHFCRMTCLRTYLGARPRVAALACRHCAQREQHVPIGAGADAVFGLRSWLAGLLETGWSISGDNDLCPRCADERKRAWTAACADQQPNDSVET